MKAARGAVFAFALWLAGCGEATTNTSSTALPKDAAVVERLAKPPSRGAEGYVGSAACAECHSKIAERYALHPMAKSVTNVLDDPLENYLAAEFSPLPARKYKVEREGDAVRHRELGFDSASEPLYDQAVDIRYAIGSGRRGRSYVIERDGLLFISPISWYASSQASAGRWDLSPQYDALGSLRFERPAYERCLHCHAGAMRYDRPPGSELAIRYREPVFAEMAIGCERCHGPGERHVAARRASREADRSNKISGDDSIVHPGKLAPAQRDAVCNQCHLHGEAMILRYGRTHADFRPGDSLGEIWSCFVDGPSPKEGGGAAAGVGSDNRTRAVSQGEQMVASVCYQKSEGRLGCVSCHDPHETPAEENKAASFNARCDSCHHDRGCSLPAAKRQAAPASGSCIACHMPALGASDVPHTTQTDHRIPRRAVKAPVPAAGGKPVGGDEPSAEAKDPTRYVIFDERETPLPPIEASRARGLMLAQAAEFSVDPALAKEAEELLQPVRLAAPDDVDTLDALAVCASLQGRRRDAAKLWKSAVTVDPRRQSALFSLAAVAQAEGNFPTALVFEERLLKLNPWQSGYYLRHARSLAGLGQIEEAEESAMRAHELDPSSPEICQLLSQILEQRGESQAAEKFLALANRLLHAKAGPEGRGAKVPKP